MLKHNQVGAISGLAISLVLTILLFFGAVGFGVWAFNSRQDYKNHVDAKISVAVAAAKQVQNTADNALFAEEAKQPLKAYDGPEAYGSLIVNFPKTWSAYVDDSGTGQALVNGYFAPGTVPSTGNTASIFALRVEVLPQGYSSVLQMFAQQLQAGQVSVKAYSLPKLPKTVGVEMTGQISGLTKGTMVILPLRSQTIEIWTEGTQYLADFNNNILPNFSFSP